FVRALAFGPDGKTLVSGDASTVALLWDLAAPAKQAKPTADELDVLWKQLASEDAAVAYRAQWQLVAVPAKAIGLLKKNLRAQETPTREPIPKPISDLAPKTLKAREAASATLAKLGAPAEDALRKALAANPPLEVRKRLEVLLAELHRRPITPQEIQDRRAI